MQSGFIDVMILGNELFDKISLSFVRMGYLWSIDSRLIIGGEGTYYPEFSEKSNNCQADYILYASVLGKVLPLAHGMNTTLINPSNALPIPQEGTESCIYPLGIAYHCDKPLEVIALEEKGKQKVRDKWHLLMLRHLGQQEGYLSDRIVPALLRMV